MSETWLSCDVKLAGASASGPPPEIQLPDFLRKFGLVGANPRSDQDFLQGIWSNVRNRGLHTPSYRAPYRLVDGDRLQVPLPDLPPDMSLRVYSFMGTETSLATVCTTIIDLHPAEGLVLLGVPKDDFDPAFLEGILQNQSFFLAHPGPQYNGPFAAGETLYYPVRARQREYRDIAPTTALQDDTHNCVSVGDGIFVVTLDLAEDDQVLQLVSKHGGGPAKWRPGKVRFKVSFKNRAKAATALRTTFQILDAQGAVYYTEVHREGDWLTVTDPNRRF